MSEHSQEIKKKARSHIVKALELAHFMDEKQGDYPEQQDKYKKEIGEAKKLLRKVYPPNDVIFKELDMETNLGLNTALGGLGLGDEPFVDMKKPAPEGFGAETFDSEMGNLLVEYVETIHPDSEMQQEELMDLLVSGEYEVPLAEMKMVVERPSMAQPPMREMAMATETFNADSKEEARLKKYEKTYGKEGAKVRNRIFKRILANAQDGTKAGQWSARKAQSLTEEYEKAMKGKGKRAYKTSKRTKTQKSLKRWGDKKWRTKSGQKSSKTGERYLPEKAIKALTDEEYKKTSAKKRKDTKKGKQFSDQPKSIAKKVAKYRAESYNPESADFDPYADSEVGEYGKRLLDQALIQVFEWFNMRYGYAKEDRDFIERYGLHRYGKDHKILARSFTTGIYGEEGDFKIKEEDEYDGSTYYFPDGATQRQLEEIARQFRITHAVPTFKLEWDVNDKPYKYGITIIATVAEKDIVNQLEMYDDNQNWRDLHPRLILPPDLWSAESKPYSVDVNRSTNKEKKLMAVFEDKEGKKIKTTHFGARGMSDYTKHGDKERMERYNKRHKKNENWNDPMTAGSLSKHILWNKPSLAGSFNHFKRKFGLKGSLNVSRSAESYGAEGYSPEMEKARQMKNRYIPPNFKVERKDGRKYLFLDFDNTVRHTIPDPKPDEPARRRPPHKAEEVVLIDGVKERVHEWADAGYFVVGLTNQSNIESGFNTTQDVVDAIKRTLDLLDMQFPVYFASHKNKDLPDFNYRKPMTGMIDAAFRDFGSPNHTYSLMVGDDWEGADSGMAENAGVHFIGVLPFIENSLPQAEQVMFVYTKAGELVSILNPDDLIPTFAEEYDRKMNTFASESSYSKSTTSLAGNTMKMTMGTIVGVVGALILGYNAPAIYNRYMKKDESAAEGSVDSEQSLANQGFMEDWVGGNEGDDNLVSEGNEPTPPMISYSYNPLASTDAMSYDPATRPPSMI